jgi:hypothetical protein
MASWSVVRGDLLRRWLDARNRARCGTYAAGGGAEPPAVFNVRSGHPFRQASRSLPGTHRGTHCGFQSCQGYQLA